MGKMHAFLLRLFPSLAKKVALAVILGSLTAWGTFVFFARQTGYHILENQSQIKARAIAHLVSAIMRHVGAKGGGSDIGRVLRLAISSTDIRNAFLLSADGRILWNADSVSENTSRRILALSAAGRSPEEAYATYVDNDSVYAVIIEPLILPPSGTSPDTSRVASARYFALDLSMADVRATAIRHRTTNIILTIIIFTALGVFIYALLAVLVISPIRRLRTSIGHVEKATEPSGSVEKTTLPSLSVPGHRDEIDELYRGLNGLIERVNLANERLLEMHQSELEQADRLASVGEMAASMAHEIKNPVAGVLGALQVFHGEAGVDADRREIIAEMMNQLERVTHAVNDLLHYARPAPPHFEEIELHPLIQKTVDLLMKQFRSSGVSLRNELSPDPLHLSADKKQLQQVIWNLLLNGFQSVEGAGVVTVRTARQGDVLTITIADSGRGMSPEELKNIFKPFYTTKHKGTGLGMTISRRIIELHGGTISVVSHAGVGTTVDVVLPRNQKGDAARAS